MSGHTDAVDCAKLLNNKIISASHDGTIKIWDMETSQCLKSIPAHEEYIRCIHLINNNQVVTGSDDDSIKLWDLNTGKNLKTFKGHSAEINCIASISDSQILSGSTDNTMRIWDLKSGLCSKVIEHKPYSKGHLNGVNCFEFISDEHLLAGSADGGIKSWDLCLLTYRSFRGHTDIVTSVIKLTNDKIVSSSFDGNIRMWNLFTTECLNTVKCSTEQVMCLDVLTDTQVVAASCDKHQITVWDINSGKCLKALEKSHTQDINYLCAF